MSGGSHNYICFRIEEDLVGKMHDRELDDLMNDVAKLAHDLEWWESGDTDEDDYRNAVSSFKEKWFGGFRYDRLKDYIDEAVYNLKTELYAMIGEEYE